MSECPNEWNSDFPLIILSPTFAAMNSGITELKQQFTEVFGEGGKIHVIRAPGRVNLIGEHTDYNDGFVFPMAIEPHVLLVCRSREDDKVRMASTHYLNEIVEFK